jgi:hypothetical protein
MPRRKAPVEPIVEVTALVEPPAEDVATTPPPETAPADPGDEYGPAPDPAGATEPEPEPATPPEPEPAPDTGHVGFTTVTDPYAPNNDVVLRYPLPEVVTVTASWLSEAEAKVLRAQHQPVVDAANAVPETKAVEPEKE